jgi:regulator of cell morphogenesis and NO signaling
MTDISTATLKEIVTDDFRAAAIFEKYSLDFCCRGGKTIEQACTEKGVNGDMVFTEVLELLQQEESQDDPLNDLSLTELIRHIVTTHHEYVRNMLPILLAHTRKVAAVHGANHNEVIEIAYRVLNALPWSCTIT